MKRFSYAVLELCLFFLASLSLSCGSDSAATNDSGTDASADTDVDTDTDTDADADADGDSDGDSDSDSDTDADTETVGEDEACQATVELGQGGGFPLSGICRSSGSDCAGGLLPADEQGNCGQGLECCIDTDQCPAPFLTCQDTDCGGSFGMQLGCPDHGWCCMSFGQ